MRISDWSSDVCSSDLADAAMWGREIPTFGTCGQPRHDDGSCFDNRVNVAAARGRSFDWSCIPQMENGREERAQKPARAALRQPLWSNRWRPHGDSNPGVHRERVVS